jgi:arginase
VKLAVIGAPRSAGAFAPGQEDAPAALRDAGLLEALREGGREVAERGDTPRFRWRVDHDEPRAMNAAAVVEGVRAVAEPVAAAIGAGELPLVLGGDCTTGIGTVAGAVTAGLEPRLVYFDLHPDLNIPASVPDGAFDWTGVAHMLDIEGADDRLAGAGPRRPLLQDDDVVFLGAGPEQSTAHELSTIEARGLRPIVVDDVRADPVGAAQRAVRQATAGGRRFLVHFDVDVIDFSDVPLSENTGRGIGLSFDNAFAALDVLLANEALLGLTVTELNPHHGAEDGSDLDRFVERLAGAYRSAAGQAIR